jgi:ABC-2 type transport system ATP-binding protein
MDEAERCDEIVYLAHGNLIVQGPVKDVIASSGLHTWKAEGTNVRELLPLIRQAPGIDHAAYFGSALHVSGRDQEKLQQAIKQFQGPEIHWQAIEPSLEDAFIALMADAGVDRRNF